MRRSLCLLATLAAVVLLAAAPPATAGVHYKAVTTIEAEGQRGQQRTVVESWVDGPKAKVVFEASDTPGMQEGQYVVTKDGGQTLFLVDPKEKTYAEWDLEAMLSMLGSMMEAMGPMMNFQVDDVTVEELAKESGPSMHGLSTTHARYRTTYDMTIKVMGMGRTNSVETLQEVWATDALDEAGMGVWLRKRPATGFEEVDELIEAEMQKVQGFPLKTVTRTTTTGQKGKRSSTSMSTMEVTELERSVSIPASTFEIPEGYTRTESTLPQQEGEEEEGNPLKSIFGGGR